MRLNSSSTVKSRIKQDLSEVPKIGEVRCGMTTHLSGHVRFKIESISKNGLSVRGKIMQPKRKLDEDVKVIVENLFPLTHTCDYCEGP